MKMPERTWKIAEREILKQFSFLQSEYNFPEFNKIKIKDEYNISTRKNNIEFSAFIVLGNWNSPELKIINHDEESKWLGWDNYTNEYRIDKFEKTGMVNEMAIKGSKFVKLYIFECAKILKEKPNILEGNF